MDLTQLRLLLLTFSKGITVSPCVSPSFFIPVASHCFVRNDVGESVNKLKTDTIKTEPSSAQTNAQQQKNNNTLCLEGSLKQSEKFLYK